MISTEEWNVVAELGGYDVLYMYVLCMAPTFFYGLFISYGIAER